MDTKGILTKKSMDAADFADEMIKLEKNLDPDFYHTFYPKEAEHKELFPRKENNEIYNDFYIYAILKREFKY